MQARGSELGQADRHDRDAQDGLAKPQQVRQRAVQMRAIVHPWQEHYLGVEMQTVVTQPGQFVHQRWLLCDAEKTVAEVLFGGVDGYVQGREPLFDETVPVSGLQVSEGYEIAVEEGITVVVIPDVEGGTQTRRQLAYKTELAVIAAAA